MILHLCNYPAGGRRGVEAANRTKRARRAAKEIITDVEPIGDHSSCDPSDPHSLCDECADLLAEVQQ